MMKLYYSHNLNPRVAVAVARYLEAPVQYIRARPFHPAHMEAFRKINPNTRVPVLVDGARTLWETDAIVCRLSEVAGSDLWRTGAEQPEMIMWISWGTPPSHPRSRPCLFREDRAPAVLGEGDGSC